MEVAAQVVNAVLSGELPAVGDIDAGPNLLSDA